MSSLFDAFREYDRTHPPKGKHRFAWEREEAPGGMFAKDAEPVEHRRAVVAQVYETLRRECPHAFPAAEPAAQERAQAAEALGARFRATPVQASPALLAALKARQAITTTYPEPEDR